MEHIEVGGLRIAYERAGRVQGPPVVLVPGFVGDAASTWSQQIEALSAEHTVIAWNPPGLGGSSRPPDDFRLPDYADAFAMSVRTLGWSSAHLAGLSFGGALMLQTFARHPELARSLVLVSAYAGWAGSLTPEASERRRSLSLETARLSADDFVAAMLPSMFSTSVDTATVRPFAASVRETDPAGFAVMVKSLADADLRSVLPTIDVPTLVICGDQDVRAPLEVARSLASSIPESRLVVLPGVGHVCTVEASDSVSREIAGFLRDSFA